VKPASRDHVAGGMAAGDDKWIGISNFTRVKNLRILMNREAFQDFAVMGSWDEFQTRWTDKSIFNGGREGGCCILVLTYILTYSLTARVPSFVGNRFNMSWK